jgi:hypothetical protein
VRSEGNKDTGGTKFPVFDNVTTFTNAFKTGVPSQIKGAPKAAVDLIKAGKPYKGGEDAFWKLHRLDILDKHKLLVPVNVASSESVIFDLAHAFDNLRDVPPELAVPQELSIPPGIQPAKRQFPLKDGAELYRVNAQARNDPMAQMHMNPQFGFEVAFGEGEVVKGEPLISTLYELIQFVEGYIKRFPPLFSSQTGTP